MPTPERYTDPPYEPRERPDADEVRDDRTPAEIAATAAANPSPVDWADFAPQGDTAEHRAARADDTIPF